MSQALQQRSSRSDSGERLARGIFKIGQEVVELLPSVVCTRIEVASKVFTVRFHGVPRGGCNVAILVGVRVVRVE